MSLRNSLFRVQVPPRAGARRIETRGIFPGAVVVRGPDWNHGDDDGMILTIAIEYIYYNISAKRQEDASSSHNNCTHIQVVMVELEQSPE